MTNPKKSCGSCKQFGSPMYQGQTGVCSTCDDFSNWTPHAGHRVAPQDYPTEGWAEFIPADFEDQQRKRAQVDYVKHDGTTVKIATDDTYAGPLSVGLKPRILHVPATKLTPKRVEILEESIRLTSQDRNAQYGDPLINMSCAGELKAIFRKWNLASGRRVIGPGEGEALDMVFTKLSRIAAGDLKPDNYVDGAAYLGAAYENAVRERDGE